MRRTRRFERTVFPSTVIAELFGLLGSGRRLGYASISRGSDTERYETEDAYLRSYDSAFTRTSAVSSEGSVSIDIDVSDGSTDVKVEAPDERRVSQILAYLEREQATYQRPAPPVPVNLQRCCIPAPLRWETLPTLSAHLEKWGVAASMQSVRLNRFPDLIDYTTWEAVLDDVRKNGEPWRYSITFRGKSESGNFQLGLHKSEYQNHPKDYVLLDINGAPTTAILDDVAAFLGLTPDTPLASDRPDRTAFIAHRFDTEGEQVADRLARFLELAGFDVKTGRGFSPASVSEKVKKRLEVQAIVFVVLTPGDDATWLTQESVLAYAKDKPLFVLRDSRVAFKSALFGDLEYIPFTSPAVEATFIPVLEGLRELGLLKFA